MGNFESVEALRQAIHDDLERQLAYHQNQQIRRQITAALTASADWELPPGLLRRQSARELERMVLELKRSGFSDMEIRARENELRQNSAAQTATALKEHFILEKIAEQESLDVAPPEYDEEIHLVALQSGEPTRRVRAQLEKRGLMDVLRNQILERKVIDLLRSHAKFKDRPFKPDKADVEAIDLAAGGGDRDSGIPEVKQKVAQAEQDE
jgi:trigger factor